MKLGNFFVGNVFRISQSPHGTAQNGKAIDAVPASGTRVIAPCDMEIYYRKNDLGHQSYSYARGDGWKMVLVHCIIEKQGHVKKGTDIGYLHTGGPVHLHVAIEVNGVWDVVLNYMDRNIQLELTSGFSSQHWKSWSTWKDLQLNPITNPNWCIPRTSYERGKSQFQHYAQTRRPDLIKAGVDTMEWLVMHGSAELPAEMERLYAMVVQLEKTVVTKDAEINKLNGALGGMTTDRNKYLNLADELQKKLDGETAEINRLNLELEGVQVALKDESSKVTILENELNNTQPKIQELGKRVATLEAEKETLLTVKETLEKKLKESESNKSEITLSEFMKTVSDAIRNLFKKRR